MRNGEECDRCCHCRNTDCDEDPRDPGLGLDRGIDPASQLGLHLRRTNDRLGRGEDHAGRLWPTVAVRRGSKEVQPAHSGTTAPAVSSRHCDPSCYSGFCLDEGEPEYQRRYEGDDNEADVPGDPLSRSPAGASVGTVADRRRRDRQGRASSRPDGVAAVTADPWCARGAGREDCRPGERHPVVRSGDRPSAAMTVKPAARPDQRVGQLEDEALRWPKQISRSCGGRAAGHDQLTPSSRPGSLRLPSRGGPPVGRYRWPVRERLGRHPTSRRRRTPSDLQPRTPWRRTAHRPTTQTCRAARQGRRASHSRLCSNPIQGGGAECPAAASSARRSGHRPTTHTCRAAHQGRRASPQPLYVRHPIQGGGAECLVAASSAQALRMAPVAAPGASCHRRRGSIDGSGEASWRGAWSHGPPPRVFNRSVAPHSQPGKGRSSSGTGS